MRAPSLIHVFPGTQMKPRRMCLSCKRKREECHGPGALLWSGVKNGESKASSVRESIEEFQPMDTKLRTYCPSRIFAILSKIGKFLPSVPPYFYDPFNYMDISLIVMVVVTAALHVHQAMSEIELRPSANNSLVDNIAVLNRVALVRPMIF